MSEQTPDILRSFVELPADLPREIEVLRAGQWTHPWYGEIIITAQDLEQFVANFTDRVLLRDIPFDISHMDAEEGAPGWVRGMRSDGTSLYATIEWTDYGERLIMNRRFRYVSPEFYTVYRRPSDNQRFNNVLSKIALTNDPFFRELTPITATAGGADSLLMFVDRGGSAMPETTLQTPPETPPETTTATAAPPAAAAAGVTPEQFEAVMASNRDLTARLAAAEAQGAATARQLATNELHQRFAAMRFGARQQGRLSPQRCEEAVSLALLCEAAPPTENGAVVRGSDGQPLPSMRERFIAFVAGLADGIVEEGQRAAVVNAEGGGAPERYAEAVAAYRKEHAEASYADACKAVNAAHPELAEAAIGTSQ